MHYYYFTFKDQYGRCGNNVLQQHEGPNGFNIAVAHEWLLQHTGVPCIIENWRRITEVRFVGFKNFILSLEQRVAAQQQQTGAQQSKPPNPNRNVFALVPGGKSDEDKPLDPA